MMWTGVSRRAKKTEISATLLFFLNGEDFTFSFFKVHFQV